MPIARTTKASTPLLSPPVWTPRTLVACRTSDWSSDHEQRDRHEHDADPDEEDDAPNVHLRGGSEDLPPGPPTRRRAAAQPDARLPARAGRRQRAPEPASTRPNSSGLPTSSTSAREPLPTAPQKKSVAPVPERAASGHRVARVPPVLRPLDRLRPLRLQVRPRRPVEERRAEARPSGPGRRSTGTPAAPAPGRSGSSCTAGRTSNVGPRVSSQPTPCSAELPR